MDWKDKLKQILKKNKSPKSKSKALLYKRVLPKLYLQLVIAGLALTGMQASFLPQLVVCASLFGERACDPIGNYVVALVSMPGYLFTGKIISLWSKTPTYAFFAILFLISFLFYWLLGFLLDKKREKWSGLKGSVMFLTFAALLMLLVMLVMLI